MRFRTLGVVLFALAVAPLARADAPAAPVIVFSVGPQPLRVRIAGVSSGFVFPCASSSNTQLFEGPLEPGQQVELWTPESCVCVAHTFGDFPDSDWSMGLVACRPVLCAGFGRARRCWPNPDPTIRVPVSSAGG